MRRLIEAILCAGLLLASAGPTPAEAETIDWQQARQHWSFQPLKKPALPAVKDGAWVRNPVDAFVLAELEARGSKPAPQADAYTLLRRATFDLTGLPPTVVEIEAFLRTTKSGASPVAKPNGDAKPGDAKQNDGKPPANAAPVTHTPPQPLTPSSAFDAALTRLLNSPHYGERYGRHWLDVARYEQGKVKLKGVKGTRGELDYRDYVIRAFNQDKPFNRFIVEQLAGDLLPAPDTVETNSIATQQYFDQLTATAFLSIGPWFDECTDPNRLRLDMVDEMLTTTGKAFLGLNFNCARCHDHKYDPIPTRDYYALAGIFRSTRVVDVFNEEWKDGRLRLTREAASPENVIANEALKRQFADARNDHWKTLEEEHAKLAAAWKKDDAIYRAALAKVKRPWTHTFEAENFAGMDNLRVITIRQGEKVIEAIEGQKLDEQWVKYEVEVPVDGNYGLTALASFDDGAIMRITAGGVTFEDGAWRKRRHGWDWKHREWVGGHPFVLKKGTNTIRLEWTSRTTRFPRIDKLMLLAVDRSLVDVFEVGKQEKLDVVRLTHMMLWPDQTPLVAEVRDFDAPEREPAIIDRRSLGEWEAMISEFPRVLAVADDDAASDLPIHQRGETYRPGDAAIPRGVMQLFEHALPAPKITGKQSGRLELARWLTDAKHPLTARVIANRVWQWHFGVGLVDTPNDFGTRGNPPATDNQRKLLDWLACELIEHNWSLKHLHHVIMSSAAYGMEKGQGQRAKGQEEGAASANPKSEIRNPKSFGTWPLALGQSTRRLEVEAIYDAMASTTGKIPRQPPSGLDAAKSGDRMIYVLSNGRSPAGLGEDVRKMFAVFGYDPSGESLPMRDASTTSAQALFWLNSPLPKHFAGEFAKVLLKNDKHTDAQRLTAAYLTALSRPPREAEAQAMLAFLKSCEERKLPREEAWKRVCLALYSCSEFRYVE